MDLTLRHSLQKGCLGLANIQRKENMIENVFGYNIVYMEIAVNSKSIWLSLAGVSVFLSSLREGVS